MTTFDADKIEEKIDRVAAGAMTVNADIGGIRFERMAEIFEFSKLMSVSHTAVPPYLRGNPGDCLAITLRALRWRMDPFAVAEQSYQVTNRGVTSIAYMSQLIHAVIESNAPIKGRLRYEIIGKDDERRCKVWATFKGEDKPHEYTSETLAKLRDARGRNESGQIKGSPLWETNPEVQLFYSASRQWARLYAPDVIAGVYALDEMDPAASAVDVTPPKPKIGEKLKQNRKKQRGFDPEHVTREIDAQNGVTTAPEADTPETVAAKATQARTVMETAQEVLAPETAEHGT